jgi:hypothetical protein
MDVRYAQLLAWKRRKVAPEDGLGLYVVVIDELALYLVGGDRKARERLADSLRGRAARGRAAGVVVLAARSVRRRTSFRPASGTCLGKRFSEV